MRTLQRLRHTRSPNATQMTGIRRAEDRTLRQRRRGVWPKRFKRLGWLAIIALMVVGISGFLARKVVIEGLVIHPNMITPLAPAQVRVTELFVQPGDRCERGDILARLEAVDSSPRRALEEEVEERRTRLALARAGGDLDGADVGRRADLAEQAELEGETSRADHQVQLARLSALEQEHHTLVTTLEQAQVERRGRSASLREGLRRASASEESALAERRRAELDSRQKSALEKDGIVSRRDSIFAEVDRSKAESGVVEAAALVESLQRELEFADELTALEIRRAKEALEGMQARIEVARREADSARMRAELWTELAAGRRALLPGDEVDGAKLRELELRVLEAQLRRAEASLESLDRELGNLNLLAESAGVVDQVFVAMGSIVDKDAPLVRYYDPAQMRVVVYAKPGTAEEFEAGTPCRIYAAESRTPIEARIRALGLSWTPLPGMLQGSSQSPSSMPHLPIRIECDQREDLEAFRPNMRLRVVVHRDEWVWN